jgi:hypothetical protein
VARALADLPLTRNGFERGQLSYAKVRVLTRVADEGTEAELLELASHATAAQLERMLRAFMRVTREDANAAYDRRHVSYHWDDDGSLCISARLPADEGALVLRALEASRDALLADARPAPTDSDASPSANGPAGPQAGSPAERPTNADALVAAMESALAAGPAALSGPERQQLVVHVDLDSLARERGRTYLRDGPALAPETARRLGCDTALVPLAHVRGSPLSVGRRTRSIPPDIRRALDSRDASCRFPGCERRRFVDAHHIRHWAEGGETSIDNLVLLCRHHHRLVHEGGYTVTRMGRDAFEFRTPRGRIIQPSPSLPRAPEPPLAPAAARCAQAPGSGCTSACAWTP